MLLIGGASFFLEKINGKYYKPDRPGGGDGSIGDIGISASPDLIHLEEFKPVINAGYRFWNVYIAGLIKKGWEIYDFERKSKKVAEV